MGDPTWDDGKGPTHYLDHPPPGFVRTWFDAQNFLDIALEDAEAMHVDNFTQAEFSPPLSEWTEWDLAADQVDAKTLRLSYANGAQYDITLGWLEFNPVSYERLLNQGNYLILPASENLTPLFNAMCTRRMFEMRRRIHELAAAVAQQNLQMAELVSEFAYMIADLGEAAHLHGEIVGTGE